MTLNDLKIQKRFFGDLRLRRIFQQRIAKNIYTNKPEKPVYEIFSTDFNCLSFLLPTFKKSSVRKPRIYVLF